MPFASGWWSRRVLALLLWPPRTRVWPDIRPLTRFAGHMGRYRISNRLRDSVASLRAF
jgi:hypothetical protein